MEVTEIFWLIICVSFIFSLISTLMFVTLLKNYTINLYKKCRNTIVLTPFEKAGHAKSTKFRVIKDCYSLKIGDIVTLYGEEGNSRVLEFKTEDGWLGLVCLPNTSPLWEELEVYEESKEEVQ